MARLADALSRLTGLQHLQLKGRQPDGQTGMGNAALTILAPALRCLMSRTHLELDGDHVHEWSDSRSPVGAQLLQSLAALTLLEVLDLDVQFDEDNAAGLV